MLLIVLGEMGLFQWTGVFGEKKTDFILFVFSSLQFFANFRLMFSAKENHSGQRLLSRPLENLRIIRHQVHRYLSIFLKIVLSLNQLANC